MVINQNRAWGNRLNDLNPNTIHENMKKSNRKNKPKRKRPTTSPYPQKTEKSESLRDGLRSKWLG